MVQSIRGVVAFIFLLTWSWGALAVDLSIAVSRGPVTLDPYKATDAASVRLLRMIAPGVLELDRYFQPSSPYLKRFGHKHYKMFYLELKEGVTFTDGSALTLDYLKSYYEGIMDDKNGSPLRGAFKDVESIEINQGTLTFNLSKPNPFFWSSLEISLVKFKDGDRQKPLGLGVYQLADWDQNGDVTLKRLDGYQTLYFKVIKDPVVRYLKLERGEIDIIHNDIGEEILQYGLENGFKVVESPSTSYTYMGFLMDQGTTADFKVRRALSYAINRGAIVQNLLGGRARPAYSLLMDDHPAHHKADIHSYDPQKAVEILEEAGYQADEKGERLKLRLAITSNPFIQRLAQVIQQDLKAIGVTVDISSSEWGTFYGNIKKGNFESYILTWVGRFQSDIYYNLFHTDMQPPNGANRGRYSNPVMDQMLDQMMRETDDKARHKLVRLVQKWQEQDMIYLPLWKRSHVALVGPNVKDYAMYPDGGYEGLMYATK